MIRKVFEASSNIGSRLFIPPRALFNPSHIEERKPNNPFHNFHFSELQLKSILSNYFRNVERIDDCQKGFIFYLNRFLYKFFAHGN